MVHPVGAIANAFLNKAAEDGTKISHMKLQKLIYYANGYHLAATGESMIDHTFEAWDYGPVAPALYHDLKSFGVSPISKMCTQYDWETGEFTPIPIPTGDKQTTKIIDFVWKVYGKYSALQLSDMTHADGSPWDRTRKLKPNIRDADIPDDYIVDHFRKFVRKKGD